jgi:hypothetical protein
MNADLATLLDLNRDYIRSVQKGGATRDDRRPRGT